MKTELIQPPEVLEEDGPPPVELERPDYKAKDQQLFHAWKQSGSKKDLGALITHLNPIIYHEVSRASGSLPVAALSAEAKKWAVKAVQTYDPDRGVALSTHVMSILPKVRRLNYKHQNAVRLPENMQLKFHEYNRAVTQLSDELNRDPEDHEIAKRLGWSKGVVVKFKNRLFSDLFEGNNERPTEFATYDDSALKLQEIISHLTPEEKFIFDNKKNMSQSELAARLGVNINRLNFLSRKLVDKLTTLKQEVGL